MNVPSAEEVATRNFREFLMLYNKLTENCFSSCITNMNQRSLTSDESTCIESCSSKWVNLNHRQMAVFMEVGPLAEKRLGMGPPT